MEIETLPWPMYHNRLRWKYSIRFWCLHKSLFHEFCTGDQEKSEVGDFLTLFQFDVHAQFLMKYCHRIYLWLHETCSVRCMIECIWKQHQFVSKIESTVRLPSLNSFRNIKEIFNNFLDIISKSLTFLHHDETELADLFRLFFQRVLSLSCLK